MENVPSIPDTYTYTARSALNPHNVVTMTLVDHQLRVDIPELLDTIGDIATAEQKLNEAGEHFTSQMQPVAMKAVEAITGPIALGDVDARLKRKQLTLTAWKRIGGLRLAPLRLAIKEVDNMEAAKAFIRALDGRKSSAADQRRFAGLLDYWIGWLVLLAGIVVLLRWPHRRNFA